MQRTAIKAIITDIEGTTTKISFVHEVLFPYASEHLAKYVSDHESSLGEIIEQVKIIIADEQNLAITDIGLQQVIDNLLAWIQQDRKLTPLKNLQGKIWVDGYQNRRFVSHLYPDVYPQLKNWQAEGISLYVYSSGSIAAQKLLFGYSSEGDLTDLFSGYFDTEMGAKREVSAYQKIAQQCGIPAKNCLFLSDVEQELDAAKAAGMQTCCLVRETHSGETQHNRAHNFQEVDQLFHD